ncbi:M28 family peptidase [Gloeobacter kilaueensis]|nr:M28 family peptidase [Gloeobacter kilaueensis]
MQGHGRWVGGFWAFALLLAGAGAAPAVPLSVAPPISIGAIDGYLRFLSSDLLEGRAPATRGGELAEEYIASVFHSLGLEPGMPDGSYFQKVPITVSTLRRDSLKMQAVAGSQTLALDSPEAAIFWSNRTESHTDVDGEIVFVGYGAKAPEYRWDDFKQSVRGKVLLVLVNDPPATASEPRLFGGRAMTYYGRWVYKFQEAERQGAAGAIIVHTPERAGYPWHTVISSWSGDQRFLAPAGDAPAALPVRGWITDTAARQLLALKGLNLDTLVSQAARRDFQPVATGIRLVGSFDTDVRSIEARNVVARLSGADPRFKQQAVLFTAHHDHLGIGPAVEGDRIYNGANDNASGVADLLAMAQAAKLAPPPKRSLYFAAVTAEESGLLGSAYFAEHPSLPLDRIVANLNIDGGNLLGRTRDLVVQGENKSTLGDLLRLVAREQNLTTSPDPFPERGAFYRSDQFSLALRGVPALSVAAGTDFIGRPRGWGKAQLETYVAKRYHQPSDEYRPGLDLSGAAQLSRLVLSVGLTVANAPNLPQWKPDSEFQRSKTTQATP